MGQHVNLARLGGEGKIAKSHRCAQNVVLLLKLMAFLVFRGFAETAFSISPLPRVQELQVPWRAQSYLCHSDFNFDIFYNKSQDIPGRGNRRGEGIRARRSGDLLSILYRLSRLLAGATSANAGHCSVTAFGVDDICCDTTGRSRDGYPVSYRLDWIRLGTSIEKMPLQMDAMHIQSTAAACSFGPLE